MSTPRAVISIELPAVKSVRVETTYDVDHLAAPQATIVIRTAGESYFLSVDPSDIPVIRRALSEYEADGEFCEA